MIVGMDVDDTISRHPEFFSYLSKALQAGGHSVVIVTVREDHDDTDRQLREWGIAFDRLVTLPSGRGPVDLADWKARTYAELAAEIVFEDSVEVVRRMDANRTVCLVPADAEVHEWARPGA